MSLLLVDVEVGPAIAGDRVGAASFRWMARASANARSLDEAARIMEMLVKLRRRAAADSLEVPAGLKAPVAGAPVRSNPRGVRGVYEPQPDATWIGGGPAGHAGAITPHA